MGSWADALLPLAAGALLLQPSTRPERAEPDAVLAREIARLESLEQRLKPGSAQPFKARSELERLRSKREGGPNPDNPDEFARLLHEMRVPADRTTSEYTPGYRTRERSQALQRIANQGLQNAAMALPWINRGPGNVSGRVRALVVDPEDPLGQTWFVGAVGGGIWKTTDASASWTDLAPDLANLAIGAVAGSNPDIFCAGIGESMFNIDIINGSGILKSVDRGVTWSQLASTLDDPRFNNIARIVVDPTNPDIVLVACTTGRYKSSLYQSSSHEVRGRRRHLERGLRRDGLRLASTR